MSSIPRLKVFTRWLKANPIIGLLGVAGTIFGVVKGAPPAWDATTQILGIPRCLTYASVYYYPSGRFEKDGLNWVEHGDTTFTFREIHRDRNNIVLLNTTPRAGRQSAMILRIPVCSGTAQWSYQNPQQWIDLYETWR